MEIEVQTPKVEDKPVFTCEICGKVCKSEIGLRGHQKTHKKK
jgi:hypothetical protein